MYPLDFTLPSQNLARSPNRMLFGVCAGIAERFGFNPASVRIFLFISIFFFGFGIGTYLLLAFSLPKAEHAGPLARRRILGVCQRIAWRFDFDLGIVRTLAALALITSFGLAILGYLVLHITMDEIPSESSMYNPYDSRGFR